MQYESPEKSLIEIYNEEDEAENAISDEMAVRIGKFVVSWGSLEHVLEGYISSIFFVPPFQRIALSAGLAIDAKISQIQSGIGLVRHHLSTKLKDDIKKSLQDLRELNTEYRNFIFHWSVFVDAKHHLKAGKLKGGNSPKVEILKINEEYFDIALAKIAINRMYLRGLLNQLQHELYPLKESWLARQAETHEKKLRRREEERERAPTGDGQPRPKEP